MSFMCKSIPQKSVNLQKGPPEKLRSCLETKNAEIVDIEPNIECRNAFQALADLPTIPENQEKIDHWIFDCGATDTMSYDASDFANISTTQKSYIQTASGDLAHVQGAGPLLFCLN